MYGFAYAVSDENHVLVRPFWQEELEKIYGTGEQIEDIRVVLEQAEEEQVPVVVTFNKEELELATEQELAVNQEAALLE